MQTNVFNILNALNGPGIAGLSLCRYCVLHHADAPNITRPCEKHICVICEDFSQLGSLTFTAATLMSFLKMSAHWV